MAASKNSRNNQYQFWQQNNQAEELLTNYFTDQKLEYIHQNPVQEGCVEEAHHSLYSSTRDYSGLPGLVPITFTNGRDCYLLLQSTFGFLKSAKNVKYNEGEL